MKDPYFLRSEVSNSDLTKVKNELFPKPEIDLTKAHGVGTLVDMLITEINKIDFINRVCADYNYSIEEYELAKEMKKVFLKDAFCSQILRISETQKIMFDRNKPFTYSDFRFHLPVRCKWDFWMPILNWGADLKTTTATTQKQFEDAALHFDYDRQRYFYMNIANSEKDCLIAISKENLKIFKINIKRGDKFWESGKEKTNFLAYKYFTMFN
jgi:hypothetical protein